MRFILLLFFAFIHGCGCYANTLKAKGQSESDSAYSDVFRLETPNKSLTKIGDKKVLLETGNKNWLANPNFAAPMVSTVLPGWLKHSGVSWSLEADGTSANKVLKASIAAATYSNDDLVFYSDLITSKGDNTGKNLIGKMWIKSANAGYKLCVIVDSVTQHCTDIIADSTRYIEYKTPIFSGGGDSTEYRLGIYHKAHTAGSTQDLYHKEAYLGPTSIAMGTIVTKSDEYQWTPTVTGLGSGSGTATGVAGRVGDRLVGYINFTKDATAGTGSSTVSFSLPAGLKIKTGFGGPVGTVHSPHIQTMRTCYAAESGGTYVFGGVIAGSYAQGSAFVANADVRLEFSIPIEGWTAGARVSDGYDGQPVNLEAATSTTQSIPTLAWTKVTNLVASVDTATGFSSNKYVIKSAGDYDYSYYLPFEYSAAGTFRAGWIYKNGSSVQKTFSASPILGGLNYGAESSGTLLNLKVGDEIEVYAFHDAGTNINLRAGSTLTLSKRIGAAYISPMAGEVKSTSGNLRVLTGRVTSLCTSSPCTVANSVGGVASVTRAGTGSYSINVTPAFGGQFQCFIRCSQTGTSGNCVPGGDYSSTTTGFGFLTYRGDTNTAVDSTFQFMCIGPQ